jgi:hypothetical protein
MTLLLRLPLRSDLLVYSADKRLNGTEGFTDDNVKVSKLGKNAEWKMGQVQLLLFPARLQTPRSQTTC